MRKTHSPSEKTKIAVEVLRGERTINEIAAEHNIRPNQLSRWKSEAIAGMPSLFEENGKKKNGKQKRA
jgi:transposase-like protein